MYKFINQRDLESYKSFKNGKRTFQLFIISFYLFKIPKTLT